MLAGDLLRRLDSSLLPVLVRGAARLSQPAQRIHLLGATATVSVAAVAGTAIWAADRPGGGGLTVGEVRVGVAIGDSIPAYVEASRAELASLERDAPASGPPAETYALVTLTEYVNPARLAPMLSGVSVAEVVGRVPLPDTQTEIVRLPAPRLPADAEALMAVVADGKDREARDYGARGAALVHEGEQERELRRWYEMEAAVARAEAAFFRAKCACLYAAVVRGTPSALRELTRRPGVRTVDPAPEVQRPDRAIFLPPLPEQTDIVRPPADADPAGLTPAPFPTPAGSATPPAAPTSPAAPAAAQPSAPAPGSASPSTVPAGTPSASPAPSDASPSPEPTPAATPTAETTATPTSRGGRGPGSKAMRARVKPALPPGRSG